MYVMTTDDIIVYCFFFFQRTVGKGYFCHLCQTEKNIGSRAEFEKHCSSTKKHFPLRDFLQACLKREVAGYNMDEAMEVNSEDEENNA